MCGACVTKVACIGDSITEGYGLNNQAATSYPQVLSQLLGNRYSVLNSGRSATALQKRADFPYWISKEFANVFVYKPQLIVISLGTNDTKPYNRSKGSFEADYRALIDTLMTIKPRPTLFLCKPVPVFETTWGINDSCLVNLVCPTVDKLAKEMRLHVIDLYTPMKSCGSDFPDHIHPNERGAARIAHIVADAISQ